MTKRKIKRLFDKAELSLTPAIQLLMFEHDMEHGAAFRYLIFARRYNANPHR